VSNLVIVWNSPKEGAASIIVTNIFMTAVFAAIVYFVAHGKATASELLVFMWFSLFELFQLSIVHDVVALSEREEARKIARKAKKEAKEEVEKETNVKIPEDLDTETSPFGEPETSGMALPLETSGESTGADEARLPLNEISSWTKLMIAIRWMAFNGFYLWFWFHGLTVPNILQCMEPRVFLFANLGAYGNARTFFKILFVVVTVMGLYYLTLMAILYIITGSLKSPSKRHLQETSADERSIVTWLKKWLEVFAHDETGKAERLQWPDLVLPIVRSGVSSLDLQGICFIVFVLLSEFYLTTLPIHSHSGKTQHHPCHSHTDTFSYFSMQQERYWYRHTGNDLS
jgi:hypothetical protein